MTAATKKNGTIERSPIEIGALPVAVSGLQTFMTLMPKLMRVIDVAASTPPVQSTMRFFCGGTGLSKKLRAEFDRPIEATSTNDYRHPIVEANCPAMKSEMTCASGMLAAMHPMAEACCLPRKLAAMMIVSAVA
jgi:hypothetical protein